MTMPLTASGLLRTNWHSRARRVLVVAALFCWVNVVEARPAQCWTSDEGKFKCEFRATDRKGSFKISAPGKPTYILNMTEPGVAQGFMNLGDQNVPLPGRYLRSERGCWVSDKTKTKICAR
jgi:hypothetical protein